MAIRILRLMEYTFQDPEQVGRHMSQCAVPLDGARDFGTVVVRSACIGFPTIPAEVVEDEPGSSS